MSENPLELPEVHYNPEGKSKDLAKRGGEGINTANPDTPAFMVKDQSDPNKLPEQKPPSEVNRN